MKNFALWCVLSTGSIAANALTIVDNEGVLSLSDAFLGPFTKYDDLIHQGDGVRTRERICVVGGTCDESTTDEWISAKYNDGYWVSSTGGSSLRRTRESFDAVQGNHLRHFIRNFGSCRDCTLTLVRAEQGMVSGPDRQLIQEIQIWWSFDGEIFEGQGPLVAHGTFMLGQDVPYIAQELMGHTEIRQDGIDRVRDMESQFYRVATPR